MNYTITDLELNGVPRLGVTLGSYPHVTFVVGAVEFLEVDGYLKVKYKYDIVEGDDPVDKKQFEKDVGDFIVWYFQNADEHPVAYTGGT